MRATSSSNVPDSSDGPDLSWLEEDTPSPDDTQPPPLAPATIPAPALMGKGGEEGKGEREGAASPPERATLVLRHIGGALAEVDVLEATDDGALHVRWRAVGSPVYLLHVFKTAPPGYNRPGQPTTGYLFKSKAGRKPLLWQALNVDAALALWRSMTGRDAALTWEKTWIDGKLVMVPR